MVSSSQESTHEQTNREARILTISRSNEIVWYTNTRRDNVESRRNLLLTNCPSTFTTERYDKTGQIIANFPSRKASNKQQRQALLLAHNTNKLKISFAFFLPD